jgi:hypothetical protein
VASLPLFAVSIFSSIIYLLITSTSTIMKTFIRSAAWLLALCVTLFLTNCQKKVTDLKPPPPVDSAIVNAMYPATRAYYDGNTAYPTIFKYEYDKNNHLTKYGRDSSDMRFIGTNQVDETLYYYDQAPSGKIDLASVSVISYLFTLVGTPNTSVNFNNTAPTQVTYSYFDKNVKTGVTQSRPGGEWQFLNNKAGLPVKAITSDGGGRNYNFNYYSDGNLKTIEFVDLSGPRAGALYYRLTFTTLDDKPSPFSNIKNYWAISYPQAYPWDFALAYCKNNPVQVNGERYDINKGAFVPDEKDDFRYEYNDKGYPTKITVFITYYRATTTNFSRTYNYTYK